MNYKHINKTNYSTQNQKKSTLHIVPLIDDRDVKPLIIGQTPHAKQSLCETPLELFYLFSV